MFKTAKQVVAKDRSERRRSRSNYDLRGSFHDQPLSADDVKVVFAVCADHVEAGEFEAPSFPKYIDLQDNWHRQCRTLRTHVTDAVYKQVSKRGSKSRHLSLQIEKSWCAVAGANFYGYFLNALRHHSRVMSKAMWRQAVFIRYSGMGFSPKLTDIEGFDRAWQQNPTLTLFACTADQYTARSLGDNCFGQVRQDWLSKGGTAADFRWFSNRSRSWLMKALNVASRLKLDAWYVVMMGSALRLRSVEFSSIAVYSFLRSMAEKEARLPDRSAVAMARHGLLVTAMKRSLENRKGGITKFNPTKYDKTKGNEEMYCLNQVANIKHFLNTLSLTQLQQLSKAATLTSLKHKAEEWALEVRRRAREKMKQRVFPSVKEPLVVVGPYQFEFLKTGFDLVEEGERNRHCIADYVDRCVLGTFRAYRMSSGDRSVTTSMKVRDGRWAFDQLEGFYGWSSADWRDVMKAFVGYMNIMDPPAGISDDEGRFFDAHHLDPHEDDYRLVA